MRTRQFFNLARPLIAPAVQKQLHEQIDKLKQLVKQEEILDESLERSLIVEKLSRRKLIAQVSVGAGVAGILATTAACTSPSNAQTQTTAPAGNTPVVHASIGNMPAQPLAVLVTDQARGTIVVIRGDNETIIDNPSLVQSILAIQ